MVRSPPPWVDCLPSPHSAGPYPRHPDCAEAMSGTLDADDNSEDRCRVQGMLAERGVCPEPRLSELHQPAWFGDGSGGGDGGTKIRECRPPPRTHSFVRHMRAEDAGRRAASGAADGDLSPPGVGVGGNLAAQPSGHTRVVAGQAATRPRAPPAADGVAVVAADEPQASGSGRVTWIGSTMAVVALIGGGCSLLVC